MGYRLDRIDPAHTALIVIDMQHDFLAPGAALESPEGREMLPTLNGVVADCRRLGVPVIFTAHVHRADGSDMGRYADLYPPIAQRVALIDGQPGAELYGDVAREPGDLLIKKHRYSAFYGTDLDMILHGLGVETVVTVGVTTEDCVHATARDAMFRDYHAVVLSDACATYDHPDLGHGAMSAAEVHAATLVVLAQSTADVMTSVEFTAKISTP
ncbi:cysteine hydrolase family protein [Pseudonocardia spinosispora]|uniref:cysteine hydrolase family protein n=1 Tax=Pseudonocardia spinosispora TaxID=103441 RepID=UPI0003F56E02|nr:cysteine hydrolase [Pseudonocardia spinosispora]